MENVLLDDGRDWIVWSKRPPHDRQFCWFANDQTGDIWHGLYNQEAIKNYNPKAIRVPTHWKPVLLEVQK